MGIRRLAVNVGAAALSAGLVLSVTPAVQAGDVASSPDLSGRWLSVLAKSDEGWIMTLRPVAGQSNVYVAKFTGRFGEGSEPVPGPTMRLSVRGTNVRLAWRGVPNEAPAPGQLTIVRGTIGQDGSIFLPRCYEVLTDVTKQIADEGCLFQERPSS